MADTKISALTAASALTGTEEFAVVQGGASKKATADQITAAGPAWTAYTPTWTATTNPAIGNGSIAGRYQQRGKTVTFSFVLTVGSTTTLGTGNFKFGLPVAPRDNDGVLIMGQQTGPNRGYQGRGVSGESTVFLNLTSDFTAASGTTSGLITGSVLRVSGTYEAA